MCIRDRYKAAHFNFSVSNYNENTTVERIVFQGQTYEQYTGFMFGFVNGQKTSYAFTPVSYTHLDVYKRQRSYCRVDGSG